MSSKVKLDSAGLEKGWNVTMPQRLKDFYDKGEWEKYEGSMVTDLAYFSSDVKEEVSFTFRDYLGDKYEYSEHFIKEEDKLFPLCDMPEMDGTFYMAADLSKPEVPVLFFDYESGFQPHSDSLDAFLKSLLKPGQKTQSELMDDLYKEAKALYDDEKYEECKNKLESGFEELSDFKVDVLDHYRHLPGAGRNLLALCYKSLGETDKALNVFDIAVEAGDKNAALNVMSIYLDRKDWQAAADYAEEKTRKLFLHWDDYSAFYSFLYRGVAYAHLGNEKLAVKFFGFIATRFLEKNPSRIDDAIERLQEIEEEPALGIAKDILVWLQQPETEIDDAQAAELKAWWDGIKPEKVQTELADSVKKKPAKMTPEDILALQRHTSVKLDHTDVADIGFISAFTRLRKLSLEDGKVNDISPLKELKFLEDVSLEGNPIKDFSPLADLKRLEKLDICETGCKDLTPIAELKNLRKLRATENGLASVEPLQNMPELTELTIYSNELTDLNPLATNKLLKEVSCFGNPLEDMGIAGAFELRKLPILNELDGHWNGEKIKEEEMNEWRKARPWTVELNEDEVKDWQTWWSGLSDEWKEVLEDEADEVEDGMPTGESFFELRKENHFSFDGKELKDMTPITRFARADYISLDDNGFTEFPDLSNLTCVRTLSLRKNKWQSMAALGDLPVVASISFNNCELESVADFPPIASLRDLDLNNNKIKDVAALGKLTGLRNLELIDNEIENVDELGNLKELRSLFIQQNNITDVSALAGCENLGELVVFSNSGLKGLLALKDLPYLYRVRSHGAFSGDEVIEFRKLRPDVDLL